MKNSELVPISFSKVIQTRSYTVVILGTTEKRFAIYTEPGIGKTLQMHLMDAQRVRPLTHDLINMLLRGLDVEIDKVVINDIQDTVYFARLFLKQKLEDKTHIVELDARPSDCITLALMNSIPVFCTQEVLEKTVAVEDE